MDVDKDFRDVELNPSMRVRSLDIGAFKRKHRRNDNRCAIYTLSAVVLTGFLTFVGLRRCDSENLEMEGPLESNQGENFAPRYIPNDSFKGLAKRLDLEREELPRKIFVTTSYDGMIAPYEDRVFDIEYGAI